MYLWLGTFLIESVSRVSLATAKLFRASKTFTPRQELAKEFAPRFGQVSMPG